MPTGALTPIVRWQVSAAAGAPVPGAQLHTFLSGTSTPQPVYHDAALTTPHAQPVVADSHGTFPVIYLAPVAYRMRVTTAEGVTVFPDQDNVYDFAQVQFGGPTGSDLIGFIQAGLGAVPRTALSKMREIVSVKDFGALGDGVQDDAPAITAAAAALTALGGGSLYFPGGTYLVNATLHIPSRVTFYGENRMVTVIQRGPGIPPDAATVHLQAELAGFRALAIHNQGRPGHGIAVVGGNNGLVDEVSVIGVVLGACLYINVATGHQFRNLVLQATVDGGRCVWMQPGAAVSRELTFDNVLAIATATDVFAVELDQATGLDWQGCNIVGNAGALSIRNCNGVRLSDIALVTQGTLTHAQGTLDIDTSSNIAVYGGTITDTHTGNAVIALRADVRQVSFDTVLIARLAAVRTPALVQITLHATEAVNYGFHNCAFACNEPDYRAVETINTGAAGVFDVTQCRDAQALGEWLVSAQRSTFRHTRQDTTFLAGSSQNLLLGHEALFTDHADSAILINSTGVTSMDMRSKPIFGVQMLDGVEAAEPAAPAANGWRLFGVDDAGKTVLKVRFATGASIELAREV